MPVSIGYAPSPPLASEFEINFLTKAFSNTAWASFVQSSDRFLAGRRATSDNNQNNEVVFRLPITLMAGTWTLVLVYSVTNSQGIYTVSVSPDAATFTDLGTIDAYAASSTLATRTELTGLTIASGINYLRLKMATKNASSSAYGGIMQMVAGVRTGA